MSGCDGCAGGSCETCSSGENGGLPPGMLKRYDIDQSTADGVLVFVERNSDGSVSDVGAELLAQARRMTDARVFAVVFGGPEVKDLYPEIFGCGADTLYHVRDPRLAMYLPEAWAESISALAARIGPAVMLFGATPVGRELAPRVAASMHCGLTADCTGLSMSGRDLTATRPAFGGSVTADIGYIGYPQMATVRPGAFARPEKKKGTGTAIYWQQAPETFKRILEDVPCDDAPAGIASARILISLGDGVRDRSLIDVAESVAERMGAAVSCSRALVEKGWMPRSRQIGMSGSTVRPDLYIAFGISGAVQHRAGMSGSGKVIAVNSDPDAPIHRFADVSLIADAGEVLRSLERRLRTPGARERGGQYLLHMAGYPDVAPGRLHSPVPSDKERRAYRSDGLLAVGHLGAPCPDLLHEDVVRIAEELDLQPVAVDEPPVRCYGVPAHSDDRDVPEHELAEARAEIRSLPRAPGSAVLRVEVYHVADALKHRAVERLAVLVAQAEIREPVSNLHRHRLGTACRSSRRLWGPDRSRRIRRDG